MSKNKKIYWEMVIAEFAMWLILGFFIMIAASQCNCGHIRLPDRSRCVTPWEQRVDCIDDTQCGAEEICAKRGRTIGKCTLIDCCNPWRNGPRLMSGDDWCKGISSENLQKCDCEDK